MPSSDPKFLHALEVLADQRVDFLVVGGVAAALWAAGVTTFDLDILYSQEPDNVDRLIAALGQLDAIYRDPAGRRIEPRRELLESGGHHRFLTSAGALDVLATVGAGHTYADLAPRSEPIELSTGTVRVLSLDALIQTKEEAGRAKDHAWLPVLRETLLLKDQDQDQ